MERSLIADHFAFTTIFDDLDYVIVRTELGQGTDLVDHCLLVLLALAQELAAEYFDGYQLVVRFPRGQVDF